MFVCVCACVWEGRGRGGCGTLSILTSIWNKSPFESDFSEGNPCRKRIKIPNKNFNTAPRRLVKNKWLHIVQG